jgi:hypothetical protein
LRRATARARFRVLEQILGHGVILHDLTIQAHRAKGAHAACLEIWAVRVVNLEVDGVVSDQSEEELAAVDPHPTEHGATAHAGRAARQLFEDEGFEAWTDAHHDAAAYPAGFVVLVECRSARRQPLVPRRRIALSSSR